MGKTYQSTIVDAPIDDVWAAVRDFHDMSWAPNIIQKLTVVGNRAGDQVGARRVLNDAFHETLHELSELEHSVRYSVDDGPSPVSKDDVSDYIGWLRLKPVTDTGATFVEWSSAWHGNDDDAQTFCHNIYTALLNDLKNHFS